MAFAHVGDVTLHYRVESRNGAKPWIVLINSLGTDLRIWDGVVAALASEFCILSHDKRGHGLSELAQPPYVIADHTRDVIGLMDTLGIARALVCGVSVGGQIALDLALTAPGRVAGLVLSNTAAKIGTAQFWAARIAAIEDAGLAGIADGVLERWFSPVFRAPGNPDLAGYRTMLLRQPVAGYLGTCAALRDFDRTTEMSRIGCPVACIAGSEDGATPPAVVEALASSIPGADYHLIDGVGHLPGIEAPERVAAVIRGVAARAALGQGELL